MSFSPIGFVFCCFHLLSFVLSKVAVEQITDEQPVTIFMDSLLAYIQTIMLQWVQSLNAVLIFLCNLLFYDRDQRLISKLQLVENHIEALGFNMPKFYRQALRNLFLVLILAILLLVGLFVEGLYFYSRVVDKQYFISYGVAFVMPTIYIQVQLVQFIILLTFQTVLLRQLNAILWKVLSIAVEEDGTDSE